MNYFGSLGFVFRDNDSWGMNILLICVCFLIPVVGPIVMMGYLADMLQQRLVRDAPGYPNFKFDQFMYYLQRGIWPFLVALIVGLVLTPLIMVIMIPVFIAIPVAAEADSPALILVAFAVTFVIYLAAIAVAIVVMTPFMLAAALTGDFSRAFNMGFVKSFVSKCGMATLGMGVFMMVVGFFGTIIGYLMCIIGLYPVIACLMYAQWNLYEQLYRLYIERGGEPLEFYVPPAPPQPVPAQQQQPPHMQP